MAVAGGSVARRYARALFGIGVDAGRFEELGRELDEFVAVWADSAELRQTLENPVFKLDQRRAVLAKLLPMVAPSVEVRNFALMLLDSVLPAASGNPARLKELGNHSMGRLTGWPWMVQLMVA
jgi:hypothetical protein